MSSVLFPGHDLRLLVLITTHFSPSHRHFLEKCWTRLVAQPFFSGNRTSFHFYTTPNMQEPLFNIDNYSEHLRSIFPRLNFTHSTALNKGMNATKVRYEYNEQRQAGAKSAVHDTRMQAIFANYEWIMRLNPDVIVFDAARILKMMHMRQLDAIICNCNWRIAREYNQTSSGSVVLAKPWPLKEYNKFGPWQHAIVMTDFMLFRPRAIAIGPTHLHVNAEYDMTNLLQGENKTIAILSSTKNKHCRVNSDEVKHVHDTTVCHGHR